MSSNAVQDVVEAEGSIGIPRPLFQGANRGIVIASVYSAALIVGFALYVKHVPPNSPAHLLVFGLIGLLAGAIGGFSNTDKNEDTRRDLQRNAIDSLIIVLWASNLVLAANLAIKFMSAPQIYAQLGTFAGGTLLGAVVGEPVLAWFAKVRIKGRQPLLWVNAVTAGIHDPDVRFVVRVAVQSVMVGLLATLAVIAALAIVALIAIAIALLIVAKVLGASVSSETQPQANRNRERWDAERAAQEQEDGERSAQAENERSERERLEAEKLSRLQGRAAEQHYDREGRKDGWTDADGRHYDREGRKDGWTDADGRHYDREGRKDGWTDAEGRRHDHEGRKDGWTDERGRHFDRKGNKDGWDE